MDKATCGGGGGELAADAARRAGVGEALRTMADHGVRRLPVIDGHELVGVVTQADIAKNCPEDKLGDLVQAISSAPANN